MTHAAECLQVDPCTAAHSRDALQSLLSFSRHYFIHPREAAGKSFKELTRRKNEVTNPLGSTDLVQKTSCSIAVSFGCGHEQDRHQPPAWPNSLEDAWAGPGRMWTKRGLSTAEWGQWGIALEPPGEGQTMPVKKFSPELPIIGRASERVWAHFCCALNQNAHKHWNGSCL